MVAGARAIVAPSSILSLTFVAAGAYSGVVPAWANAATVYIVGGGGGGGGGAVSTTGFGAGGGAAFTAGTPGTGGLGGTGSVVIVWSAG